MPYILKVGKKVIAHVTSNEGIVDPLIVVLIEPCLLAYNIEVILGEDKRTPVIRGYRVVGESADQVAKALSRCVAHVLHRVATVEEEKLYEVKVPAKVAKEISGKAAGEESGVEVGFEAVD